MRKKIAILTFLTPKEDKMKRRLFTVLAGIGLSVFMVSMAITQTLPPAWDLGEFAYQVSDNDGKVTVNPGGRGDVLIFPYYDVRETGGKTQATYFAIINTDPLYGVRFLTLMYGCLQTTYGSEDCNGIGPLETHGFTVAIL
jgi:hypothetical protein